VNSYLTFVELSTLNRNCLSCCWSNVRPRLPIPRPSLEITRPINISEHLVNTSRYDCNTNVLADLFVVDELYASHSSATALHSKPVDLATTTNSNNNNNTIYWLWQLKAGLKSNETNVNRTSNVSQTDDSSAWNHACFNPTNAYHLHLERGILIQSPAHLVSKNCVT